MTPLEKLLSKKSTKSHWKEVAQWVIQEEGLPDLIQIFLFTEDKRIAQQAAAVFMTLVDIDRNLFYPYQKELVARLSDPNATTTQLRNIFRLFQFVYIREEVEGELLDASFKVLENPTLAIAIRAFALTVAFRLGERYPEIDEELIHLIELNLELGNSAGFQNRAHKILAAIEKRKI